MEMLSATQAFNGFVLANIVFSLEEYSIWSKFNAQGVLSDKSYDIIVNENFIVSLYFAHGVKFGLFEKIEHGYKLTSSGKDIYQQRGFFIWLIGGYGQLIHKAVHKNSSDFVSLRNGEYVVQGSAQANLLMKETINDVMKNINYKNIVDIGCGTAQRLIEFCKDKTNIEGIGFEIDASVILKALDNVKSAGLADRITIIKENLLDTKSFYSSIDTILCFMMLHDLFNSNYGQNALKKIVERFPNATQFIFADTLLSQGDYTKIFTSGFELVHELQNQKLFPLDYYKQAFINAGLILRDYKYLHVPNTYVFVLQKNIL